VAGHCFKNLLTGESGWVTAPERKDRDLPCTQASDMKVRSPIDIFYDWESALNEASN
jgi:hypothetical protein